MDKKFIKPPSSDRFERIIWCANIADAISGNTTSKEDIIKTIEEEELILTDYQKKIIEDRFK